MEGNPFPQLIETFKEMSREQIRPGFRLGVVKSTSPLAVEIAGLEYRAGELMVNDLLTAEIQLGGYVWSRHLQTGDQVICLPLDDDDARYFVLAKAVEV